ncbi:hypothetical protein D3C81_2151840 [compost metagenome]
MDFFGSEIEAEIVNIEAVVSKNGIVIFYKLDTGSLEEYRIETTEEHLLRPISSEFDNTIK